MSVPIAASGGQKGQPDAATILPSPGEGTREFANLGTEETPGIRLTSTMTAGGKIMCQPKCNGCLDRDRETDRCKLGKKSRNCTPRLRGKEKKE